MKKLLFSIFVVASSVILMGVFFVLPMAAQKKAGEGLTISPPVNEVSLDKGDKSEQTIKLINPTKDTVEVYPKVMDFRAKGESGEPDFYQATDEMSKFALSKWVTFSKDKVVIAPDKFVHFKYTINVPQGAEPGGHYGVMFFASEPPETRKDITNVSLASMIGSLVLVKVPGAIIEKGLLESFSANKFLYLNNNVNFTTRVSNLGNVHFKPKGNITIKNIFGKDTQTLTVNESGGNILPDSIRKFTNEWKSDKFLFGIYKANLGIVYGESGKTLIGTSTFLIIPWWLLILIISLLILIITLLVIFIRKIKRKRRVQKSKNVPPQSPEGSGKVILR